MFAFVGNLNFSPLVFFCPIFLSSLIIVFVIFLFLRRQVGGEWEEARETVLSSIHVKDIPEFFLRNMMREKRFYLSFFCSHLCLLWYTKNARR